MTMKYSDLKSAIMAQFAISNDIIPFITGAPGGGKSSLCREVAQELAIQHGIPSDRIVEFNPSLREPSDILGLPNLSGEYTRWVVPQEFYKLRGGTGTNGEDEPAILIFEEASDAQPDMQNAMCRVILDRMAGDFRLTAKLFIMMNGNRTSDRSGAVRLSTKLGNRCQQLAFDESFPDWKEWAEKNSIHPLLIAFLDYRRNLFSDFNPNNTVNPTPRSWATASRIPMEGLSEAVYHELLAGYVGDGPANEFCGFRRCYKELVSIQDIAKRPKTTPIPKEVDKTYALTTMLIEEMTPELSPKVWAFVKRLPAEYGARVVQGMLKKSLKYSEQDWFEEALEHFGPALNI